MVAELQMTTTSDF